MRTGEIVAMTMGMMELASFSAFGRGGGMPGMSAAEESQNLYGSTEELWQKANYSNTETRAEEDAPNTTVAAEARGGVYTLRNEVGDVVRTGRTSNLPAREAAHFNDPVLGDYRFNVEYRTDIYAEQRGLEQVLYDRYPGAQAANGGFNKIRAVSPSNPSRPGYMQAAWDFLQRLGS